MGIKLATKNTVKTTITCKVPSSKRAGYDRQTFEAEIKKLYGDEKKDFLENIHERMDVDIAREMVVRLNKLDWFATDENGDALKLSDDVLADFFDVMEEQGVDYVMAPLASECVKVQDEGFRRMLEAKN